MSRFANPNATARFSLGACQCPGTPHDEDWIDLRSELGAQDVVALSGADNLGTLRMLVVRWNLLDHTGAEAPVDDEHLAQLFADAFTGLDAWVEANVRMLSLPKPRSVPSPNGSRANASHTQTTRKRR